MYILLFLFWTVSWSLDHVQLHTCNITAIRMFAIEVLWNVCGMSVWGCALCRVLRLSQALADWSSSNGGLLTNWVCIGYCEHHLGLASFTGGACTLSIPKHFSFCLDIFFLSLWCKETTVNWQRYNRYNFYFSALKWKPAFSIFLIFLGKGVRGRDCKQVNLVPTLNVLS